MRHIVQNQSFASSPEIDFQQQSALNETAYHRHRCQSHPHPFFPVTFFLLFSSSFSISIFFRLDNLPCLIHRSVFSSVFLSLLRCGNNPHHFHHNNAEPLLPVTLFVLKHIPKCRCHQTVTRMIRSGNLFPLPSKIPEHPLDKCRRKFNKYCKKNQFQHSSSITLKYMPDNLDRDFDKD